MRTIIIYASINVFIVLTHLFRFPITALVNKIRGLLDADALPTPKRFSDQASDEKDKTVLVLVARVLVYNLTATIGVLTFSSMAHQYTFRFIVILVLPTFLYWFGMAKEIILYDIEKSLNKWAIKRRDVKTTERNILLAQALTEVENKLRKAESQIRKFKATSENGNGRPHA